MRKVCCGCPPGWDRRCHCRGCRQNSPGRSFLSRLGCCFTPIAPRCVEPAKSRVYARNSRPSSPEVTEKSPNYSNVGGSVLECNLFCAGYESLWIFSLLLTREEYDP